MNPELRIPLGVQQNWRDMVDALTVETDCANWAERIKNAQDAVMDEIEDSFFTAGPAERHALINAMNALRELRRISSHPAPRDADSVGGRQRLG